MSENSLSDLMKFLDVKAGEFMEFWKSLTDEEKDEYKTADLS